VYDGVTLQLSEEGFKDASDRVLALSTKEKAKGELGSGMFVPRAAMGGRSRPRAGLGSSNRSKSVNAALTAAGTTSEKTKAASKFVSQEKKSPGSNGNDSKEDGLGQDAFRQLLAGNK
jgi:hypothetical protein